MDLTTIHIRPTPRLWAEDFAGFRAWAAYWFVEERAPLKTSILCTAKAGLQRHLVDAHRVNRLERAA